LADDDLDAPLGKKPKRKTVKLPVRLPQIVAGALGLSIVAVGGWTMVASDPYGGEPVAIVATRMNSAATASDRNVAAAAITPGQKTTRTKPNEPAVPPGSKVVTVTDGSTGKTQQVVLPPRGGTETQKKSAADPALLEESRHGQIPKIAADGRKPSLVYAKTSKLPAGQTDAARIAIVIGGLGVSASATAEAMEKLPGEVSFAFAPYTANLENLSANARSHDHELLLQAPMEPFDYPDNDPGPQTLLTSLSPAQNIDRLQWLMARMQGYVGITNFMGSRFTASDPALSPILREIAKRGLIYVDDGSSTRSIAGQIAGAQHLPFVKADITISAAASPGEVDQALARLELQARERGAAVGFAPASAAAVARISEWAKKAADRGFVLVPISTMANTKTKSS
jgi:polysaccharide deacetylase 2 family uncharacterized protein YibQ